MNRVVAPRRPIPKEELMSRVSTPIVVIASLVFIGCGGSPSSAAPAAAVAPTRPSVDLRLAQSNPGAAFADTGPFVSDPAATVNTCTKLDDGSWKVSYSGGQPYMRVDMLVGPDAVAGGPSEDVSAEIVIGSPLTTLLNFDQPGYRSGDARGRSTAVVETTSGADVITFDVAATTPRAKIDFTDYPYTVDVDLTVVCPTTRS
jgi:hypothetical protein